MEMSSVNNFIIFKGMSYKKIQSALKSLNYEKKLSYMQVPKQKNLLFSNRIFHTSSKATRGKLISYLSFISIKKKKIPKFLLTDNSLPII